LKHEWDERSARIDSANVELQRIAKQDDACHRLLEIRGFGPLVSTALVAAIDNSITFRKQRTVGVAGTDTSPALDWRQGQIARLQQDRE